LANENDPFVLRKWISPRSKDIVRIHVWARGEDPERSDEQTFALAHKILSSHWSSPDVASRRVAVNQGRKQQESIPDQELFSLVQ
jgi:hypothetical protein